MCDFDILYDNKIFLNKTSDNNIYLTQIKGHSKLKIIKISYNKNITLKIKTKYPIKLLFNKKKIRINNIKKISLNKNNVFSIKFINPEKKNKIKISKIIKKIIIVSSGLNRCESALGHEIHLSRFILFDLLIKNKISKNDTLVLYNLDRSFLYNNIFKKIISWDKYKKKYVNKYNVIKLPSGTTDIENTLLNKLYKFNYSFSNFKRTIKFENYINNINYINLNNNYKEIISKQYYLIHLRFKFNKEKLIMILNKIREFSKCKIIIFCCANINLSKDYNIIFINNLQLYTSFLNNKNCVLFISEWSGGGQISQYCYNGLILYYFDCYPSNGYELNYLKYQKDANNVHNIINAWDFKSSTKCERKYFKTLNLMIKNLPKIIKNL